MACTYVWHIFYVSMILQCISCTQMRAVRHKICHHIIFYWLENKQSEDRSSSRWESILSSCCNVKTFGPQEAQPGFDKRFEWYTLGNGDKLPRQQRSQDQHGAHLGSVGPRWAPCWPHEPCYQDLLPFAGEWRDVYQTLAIMIILWCFL